MQQAKNIEKAEKATARVCIPEELPNQALMMRKITQNAGNITMQKSRNFKLHVQCLTKVGGGNPFELMN